MELPTNWKIHNAFHASLLLPYQETKEHGRNFLEPLPELIEGQPEWEVEKVLDSRLHRRKLQYLIKWKGYSEAHNSWEPKENVNAPILLAAFHERNPAAIRTLKFKKDDGAASQSEQEEEESTRMRKTSPPGPKRHLEDKPHPLMPQDVSTYQKSQTKAVRTLVPETNNSAQNAHILRPTNDDEETRTQPSPKRPVKRLSKVEKIAQQIAILMPEVKARLRNKLKSILAIKAKNKDPRECECTVCKRAQAAEQNTRTTNDASDTQPTMIRSIRIVQERDKVPPETITGTARPKRSSPSTGITLVKKPVPKEPMTAQLTSLSEAREEKIK